MNATVLADNEYFPRSAVLRQGEAFRCRVRNVIQPAENAHQALTPAILQTSFHSVAVTGCTESRA